jgi:crossover junction endodeoxyribonuclease RusA
LILELPYPISANRYWSTRVFGKVAMTYVSPEAKAYKQHAAWAAKAAGVRVVDGDVSVTYVLHPKLTVKGEASRVRCDLDNVLKVLGDAMNGVAWVDDKQIVEIHARIGEPVKDGAISISIEPVVTLEPIQGILPMTATELIKRNDRYWRDKGHPF